MPFENQNDDPKAANSAAEKAPHAGLEAPTGLPQEVPGTQHFDKTTLDEAATTQGWVAGAETGDVVSSDVPPAIPGSLGESAAPATEEEIATARRDVESRNKKKPLWVKIGAGVTALAAAGALYIGIKPSNKAPEQTGSGTQTSAPAAPSTINPETATPTSIEQGETSVTITTPSAETTTSAPVVGEIVPGSANQASIDFVHGAMETKYGQSFAPESLLAAANSIDINNLEGKSVFGIQEMPYTDITNPEQATLVYNQFVTKEGSRIINLLIQSRGLESSIPVPQKFSGLTPSENFSVEDLILAEAAQKFAIRDVGEVAIINGVSGHPDGILQHFKTIADKSKPNEWIQIREVLPEQYRTEDDYSPVITGVTSTEVDGNQTAQSSYTGVELTLDDGEIEYGITQMIANPDGTAATVPSRGFLLKEGEGLALYKGSDGNVRAELTGYGTYTPGN